MTTTTGERQERASFVTISAQTRAFEAASLTAGGRGKGLPGVGRVYLEEKERSAPLP